MEGEGAAGGVADDDCSGKEASTSSWAAFFVTARNMCQTSRPDETLRPVASFVRPS